MAAHGAPISALPLPEATPTLALPEGWRAVDFISDLHLDGSTPRAFAAWASHLRHTRADAVFILGDLFDVWVGDDIGKRDFEARCLEVLSEAARHRTIAFMAGNRDFLVGNALLQSLGVQRLHDPTLLVAFGPRLLVSHGDASASATCLSALPPRHSRTRRATGAAGAATIVADCHRGAPHASAAAGRGRRAKAATQTSTLGPRAPG